MQPIAASTGSYRPDVDGLRAIAVLSVILFHIQKTVLPGGFVGVDVFFVISGFLITRNILQEIERGRFSILEFYRRRVKRIAPAMLVVVFATVTAAQFLLLPEDAERAAGSALWALLSLANVYFWLYQDTSYFAADSGEQPLLHLWSLGVEEQFYMIWPVLLILVYRPTRARLLFAAALVVALLSFALGELSFDADPSFAYYMLPTRAGELLFGALVAVAVLRRGERYVPAVTVGPMAMVGFVLLIGSLFLLSEDAVFPGLAAVPPTLGTALLILAGHCRDNLLSRLLAVRPMVWVGLISYSAYLWHWPMIAFLRYGYHGVGAAQGVAVFVLTMLLAWLTYLFIEQPARRSTAPVLAIFTRQYIVPAGALAVLSLGAMYIDGFGARYFSQQYRTSLQDVRERKRPTFIARYVCQRKRVQIGDTRNGNCVVGPASARTPTAVLWGDSNASHFIGMLDVFARRTGFSFRNIEHDSCPPVDGDPGPFVESKREADCRWSLDVVRPVIERFKVVIVSAAWSNYQTRSPEFLPAFFATARRLAADNRLIVLIGKVPVFPGYDRRCDEKALSFPYLQCPEMRSPLRADVAEANARLREFAARTANVEYFEATPYLCPNGVCSTRDSDGTRLFHDHSHLTMDGSRNLGERILARDGVPAPFARIAGWRRRLAGRHDQGVARPE